MTDIENIKHDPSRFYRDPKTLFEDETLSADEKIEILQEWEFDMRDMMVADEENMGGSDVSETYREIHKYLRELDAGADTEHSPGTKHGS